jgi:hypothetical protein
MDIEVAKELDRLHKLGYFVESDDFWVERLPDGRVRLHLKKKLIAGHVCPHIGDITITFSGITFGCGCQPSLDATFSAIASDIGVNDTFVVERITTGPPEDFWATLPPSSTFSYDLWDSPGCSGDPGDHQESRGEIDIRCSASGWSIIFHDPGVFNFLFFKATGILTNQPTNIPNQAVCGLNDGIYTGVATGGTATITVG